MEIGQAAEVDLVLTSCVCFIQAVALTATVETAATTMGNKGIQGGLTADQTSVRGFDYSGTKPEFTKGMKVFTVTLGGLMYQATIAGQKFNIKK